MADDAVAWAEFEASDGELAEHARRRLTQGVCYLATMRPDGFPRVHPVGAHVRDGRLVVPMKPTSPKGADIRRDGRFALHCTVEDTQGGGGEVLVTGVASEVEAPDDFARRGWITFDLRVGEVLSIHYPERDDRPVVRRWSR
jgi:Pyridoxamine 5'-phosphate oxidase